jgi:hypothetical protein
LFLGCPYNWTQKGPVHILKSNLEGGLTIMNRAGMAIVVGTLFCTGAAVQAGQTPVQASGNASASTAASAQDGQANGSLASGTAVNAELSSPIDSKKCKPGDPVNAHSTEVVKSEGKIVIPKGAKLVGHVTEASARAKGESESSLGIVFDKAILKNGQEIPLNAGIRAIAAASSASVAGSDMDATGAMGASAAGSGMAGGRGALGGVASTAGGAVGTVTNTAANVGGVAGGTANSAANAGGSIAGASKGAVGGLNAAGQFTSNSQGVFGLNGLNLNATGSNATQGSVITSAGKNVHLESGTRMLLVSQTRAGEQGAPKGQSADKPEPKSESKPGPSKPDRQ